MREEREFRIIRCDDKKLIRELHEIIFPADQFFTDDTIDWVAYDKRGNPVGFCMLRLIEEEKAGYLARAGIKIAAQGNGLHTRMIRVREKYIRSLGYTTAITYTKIFNIQSSYNLQKSGYWIYIPEGEYADADCIYWRRALKVKKGAKSVKRK